jgi:hypothetical protein
MNLLIFYKILKTVIFLNIFKKKEVIKELFNGSAGNIIQLFNGSAGNRSTYFRRGTGKNQSVLFLMYLLYCSSFC